MMLMFAVFNGICKLCYLKTMPLQLRPWQLHQTSENSNDLTKNVRRRRTGFLFRNMVGESGWHRGIDFGFTHSFSLVQLQDERLTCGTMHKSRLQLTGTPRDKHHLPNSSASLTNNLIREVGVN